MRNVGAGPLPASKGLSTPPFSGAQNRLLWPRSRGVKRSHRKLTLIVWARVMSAKAWKSLQQHLPWKRKASEEGGNGQQDAKKLRRSALHSFASPCFIADTVDLVAEGLGIRGVGRRVNKVKSTVAEWANNPPQYKSLGGLRGARSGPAPRSSCKVELLLLEYWKEARKEGVETTREWYATGLDEPSPRRRDGSAHQSNAREASGKGR